MCTLETSHDFHHNRQFQFECAVQGRSHEDLERSQKFEFSWRSRLGAKGKSVISGRVCHSLRGKRSRVPATLLQCAVEQILDVEPTTPV